MKSIIIISPKDIAFLNEEILGVKVDDLRLEKIQSCLASYMYYDLAELQIASVVSLLIKNHVFIDANKRTALAVFLILCLLNELPIKHSSEALAYLFENIAANHYSVDQVEKLLFNQD